VQTNQIIKYGKISAVQFLVGEALDGRLEKVTINTNAFIINIQ